MYSKIDCPTGYWDVDCKKQCDCYNNATCEPYTGACQCDKGYTGEKCQDKCPKGYYGAGCMEECRCENDGSCHHESGECICTPGYTGPL